MGAARAWGAAAVAYVASAWVLNALSAPSPLLFAGVVCGAAAALRAPEQAQLPEALRRLGVVVVGVAAGATIDAEVLATLGERPLAVIGGVAATLLLSLAVGQVLRLQRDVSAPTAAFASIAGGASGVSMVADEFGADAPTVLTVQYLRVLVVLATVPLVAQLLGGESGSGAPVPDRSPTADDLAFTALALAAGALLAWKVRFSASAIVLPLAVATLLSVSGWFDSTTMPHVVTGAGYSLVGLSVGVGFTRSQLRRLARLLPLALTQALLTIALCGLAGVVFAAAVGARPLDGYLATSPGGLPAVVVIALDTSDDPGLILTMQVVRVFVALAGAPLLGRWLLRRRARRIARPLP